MNILSIFTPIKSRTEVLDKKQKLAISSQVINSHTFKRGPSSTALLKFLVEATVENRDLKESTIGMELFGKSYLDEKSAASIRVNIYHLRKKLEKYYETEGKEDTYRIHIKKGQYQVEFEKVSVEDTAERQSKKFYWLTAAVILMAVGFWRINQKEVTPLWQEFFDNGKPTSLFIGDFFGIMGTTVTGSVGWNRDYGINNLEDYYRYLEDHPDQKDQIYPANYPYVTGMAATGTMNISRLFHRQNQDFNILFSSHTTIKDVTEGNSIYIGPVKNGNLFIDFFNDANPRMSLTRGMLSYQNHDKGIDTLINLSIDDGSIYEHAVVSRFKGPNDSEQFIFFSDHDIGVKATTEKFTDPNWVNKTFSDLPLKEDSPHFTAVFLVKGKERTSMELELLFWEEL